MKYLPSFLLLLVSFIAFPQANIDSLTQIVLSRNKKFTTTIFLTNADRDKLIQLLPKTKNPATRIKLIYDVLYDTELSPSEALRYASKMLTVTRKNNDKIGEVAIMAELGYTIVENGNYAEGLKMIFEALKIAEKTGNHQAIGIAYQSLGGCYEDVALKRKYLHKALKHSKAGGHDVFVYFELSYLSHTFENTKMSDSAMYYKIKSIEVAINKNIEAGLVQSLSNLTRFEKNPNRKLSYCHTALKLPYVKKHTSWELSWLTKIARQYKEQKAIDSSFFYANKAYKISQNLLFAQKMYPAKLLADLYENRNADSTLKYTKIYYSIRDSIYNKDKLSQAQSLAFADDERLRTIKQEQADYKAKVKMYVLAFVVIIFLLAALLLWRNNRKKQKAYELLQLQKEQTDAALNLLKTTQNQLIQSEKMASLGELTAGIAHEIQNPLNFVNNFSEVSMELMEEMKEEMAKGDTEEALAIAGDIEQNLEKINHHGKRADSIVKGMLQHSRASSGQKEPTDINALADEYLRLAYHGLRAKDKSFNADLATHFDPALPKVNIIPQDIGRVLLNLFTNAFYATHQKQKTAAPDYKPLVSITSVLKENNIQIILKDNGTGIPDAIKDKIMQPFFTTKPTGEGTGLGLSLSYDMVVKGHGGAIKIETQEGEGSSFIITLPLKG